MILISDGLETCGGDPCAAVRAVREGGTQFILHVIGFDVAGEDVSQLECAAQAGDGLFFSAENAQDLSAALEQAVAMPAEVPAGRLSVKVVADGALQDAAILVAAAATGEDMGGGRSYAHEGTNPRVIPLPDGRYDVKVQAVGIKGDITRRFAVDIVDGGVVEEVVDYSTGELSIGVTRNSELSDAIYRVLVPDTGEEAAAGRTYAKAGSNPAKTRLTAGTYQVLLRSVEISGDVKVDLGLVVVPPGGRRGRHPRFSDRKPQSRGRPRRRTRRRHPEHRRCCDRDERRPGPHLHRSEIEPEDLHPAGRRLSPRRP